MTQIGKCMTCRQRKVKCDEQYPKCGQCRKRNRVCQYPTSNVRRLHVTLVERVTARTNSAETVDASSREHSTTTSPDSCSSLEPLGGPALLLHPQQCHTATGGLRSPSPFTTSCDGNASLVYRGHDVEVPCVWRNLEGPEEALKARFLAMLDEQPLDINISYLWGGWLRLVASRTGRNQALDDAMLCCVAGVVAHHDRSPQNLIVASRTYGKALTSIQRHLTDDTSAKVYSSETITAAKYLTAFETILDLNGDSWEKHWRGLEKLLTSRGCHEEDDDLLKSLYYQILGHYFNGAVSEGRDCSFDSPDWLNCSPPPFEIESAEFLVMYKKLMQLIVPLARLVRLVRLVKSDVADAGCVNEAVALAEQLYQIDLDKVLCDLVGDVSGHVRTVDESLARYFPDSIAFPTTSIFEAQMRYCFCRIIVIGLCKVLHARGLFTVQQDLSIMTEQELMCAKTVAMSVQYAGRVEHHIPIGSLMAMGPLQAAAGAWFRWQRDRDRGAGSSMRHRSDAEDDQARFMMDWCRKKSNTMVKSWLGPQMSRDMVKIQVDVLEGGPLEAWSGRRLFPL